MEGLSGGLVEDADAVYDGAGAHASEFNGVVVIEVNGDELETGNTGEGGLGLDGVTSGDADLSWQCGSVMQGSRDSNRAYGAERVYLNGTFSNLPESFLMRDLPIMPVPPKTEK